VEDKTTTTDQWLALDAWKKLLHDTYDFGDGLYLGVSKLKKVMYLHGKRWLESIIVIVLVVHANAIFLLFDRM
jgi:hypothetical protein